MRGIGTTFYLTSLFILYIATDIKVFLTLTSVSLSVLYVWTVLLEMISSGIKCCSKLTRLLLSSNLIVIAVSVFVIGYLGAILLGIIFVALLSFILLARYALSRKPTIPKADSRLRYFGVLLLGFFSLNPLREGTFTHNWMEVVASVMLIISGYLIFEEIRNMITRGKCESNDSY